MTHHALIDSLAARYRDLSAQEVIADVLTEVLPGEVALVSSFGTESAVLLHMVAEVQPATPVLFIDTGKLFGETLRYRDRLVERLGLTDVRSLGPDPVSLAEEDGDDLLFNRDADRCCYLRKVLPLRRGLEGFKGWINGRKGHHGGARASLPVVEADGPRLKITPLHSWVAEDMDAYAAAHDLPAHPLVEDGYASVGCYTCTVPSQDRASGRWAGQEKTECGIHTHLWPGEGI